MEQQKRRATVSIILPTYNERENVAILIPEIELLFEKERRWHLQEIIVVDDYSPDGTAGLCRELNKKYRNIVVLQKKKEGIGAALQHGYTMAKGDILVSMDSDLSFSSADIPKVLGKIAEGADLVLGSRYAKEGRYEKKRMGTWIKGNISSLGNKLIRRLIHLKIHDFSANFRGIRKVVWDAIETKERTNLMLLEMIVKAQRRGYAITEVPVLFRERRFGKSKLNLFVESLHFLYKLLFYYW